MLIGHLDGIGLCGQLSDAFSKWKLCLVDLISTYHTLQILKSQLKGSPCQCLSGIPACYIPRSYGMSAWEKYSPYSVQLSVEFGRDHCLLVAQMQSDLFSEVAHETLLNPQ